MDYHDAVVGVMPLERRTTYKAEDAATPPSGCVFLEPSIQVWLRFWSVSLKLRQTSTNIIKSNESCFACISNLKLRYCCVLQFCRVSMVFCMWGKGFVSYSMSFVKEIL